MANVPAENKQFSFSQLQVKTSGKKNKSETEAEDVGELVIRLRGGQKRSDGGGYAEVRLVQQKKKKKETEFRMLKKDIQSVGAATGSREGTPGGGCGRPITSRHQWAASVSDWLISRGGKALPSSATRVTSVVAVSERSRNQGTLQETHTGSDVIPSIFNRVHVCRGQGVTYPKSVSEPCAWGGTSGTNVTVDP